MSANTNILPMIISIGAVHVIRKKNNEEILELLECCIERGFDAAEDPEKTTKDKERIVMDELREVAQALATGVAP